MNFVFQTVGRSPLIRRAFNMSRAIRNVALDILRLLRGIDISQALWNLGPGINPSFLHFSAENVFV